VAGTELAFCVLERLRRRLREANAQGMCVRVCMCGACMCSACVYVYVFVCVYVYVFVRTYIEAGIDLTIVTAGTSLVVERGQRGTYVCVCV